MRATKTWAQFAAWAGKEPELFYSDKNARGKFARIELRVLNLLTDPIVEIAEYHNRRDKQSTNLSYTFGAVVSKRGTFARDKLRNYELLWRHVFRLLDSH